MNRVGIMVDLSHVGAQDSPRRPSSPRRSPCTYSHCLPSGLKQHPRNKTDEQLKFIADHGGFVGVTMFPPFLKRGTEATVDDYVEAIEYMVNMSAKTMSGIGTDFTQGYAPGILRLDHPRQGPLSATDGFRQRASTPKASAQIGDLPNLTRRHGDAPAGVRSQASRRSWATTGCGCSTLERLSRLTNKKDPHATATADRSRSKQPASGRTDGLPMLYVPRHFFTNNHLAVEAALGRDRYAEILYHGRLQVRVFLVRKRSQAARAPRHGGIRALPEAPVATRLGPVSLHRQPTRRPAAPRSTSATRLSCCSSRARSAASSATCSRAGSPAPWTGSANGHRAQLGPTVSRETQCAAEGIRPLRLQQ